MCEQKSTTSPPTSERLVLPPPPPLPLLHWLFAASAEFIQIVEGWCNVGSFQGLLMHLQFTACKNERRRLWKMIIFHACVHFTSCHCVNILAVRIHVDYWVSINPKLKMAKYLSLKLSTFSHATHASYCSIVIACLYRAISTGVQFCHSFAPLRPADELISCNCMQNILSF